MRVAQQRAERRQRSGTHAAHRGATLARVGRRVAVVVQVRQLVELLLVPFTMTNQKNKPSWRES
jgi:hypothetical protein